MSWDDLEDDVTEIDPHCEWVPEGYPFSLLKLENSIIQNDYIDKIKTATGVPADWYATGQWLPEFIENDIIACPWQYPPPVRPEHSDSHSAIASSFGLKGQVLKRPYYKRTEQHTVTYYREALFARLIMSFNFQHFLSVCGCQDESGIMIPAGGGGAGSLAAGPCTNLSGDSCDCSACAALAGDYYAQATVNWESSYHESYVFEPYIDPVDDILKSVLGKSWHIQSADNNVCMTGTHGRSCSSFSAATPPGNCYCYGNPLAGSHSGAAVLQVQIVPLVNNWMDGIVEDAGEQYYNGYRIVWPNPPIS